MHCCKEDRLRKPFFFFLYGNTTIEMVESQGLSFLWCCYCTGIGKQAKDSWTALSFIDTDIKHGPLQQAFFLYKSYACMNLTSNEPVCKTSSHRTFERRNPGPETIPLRLALFLWSPVFCTLFWIFPHVEGRARTNSVGSLGRCSFFFAAKRHGALVRDFLSLACLCGGIGALEGKAWSMGHAQPIRSCRKNYFSFGGLVITLRFEPAGDVFFLLEFLCRKTPLNIGKLAKPLQ